MADAKPSRPDSAKNKPIDPEGYDLKPDEKIKDVEGRKCVVKKGANGNEIRYFLA